MTENSPGDEPGLLAPIPLELRSYLRSGVAISSFSQAVEELVRFFSLRNISKNEIFKFMTRSSIAQQPIFFLVRHKNKWRLLVTLSSVIWCYDLTLKMQVLFIKNKYLLNFSIRLKKSTTNKCRLSDEETSLELKELS